MMASRIRSLQSTIGKGNSENQGGKEREREGCAENSPGRPDWLTGRTAWSYDPLLREVTCGVCNDVPGRGTEATAFSSIMTSATPSSSASMSSM